MWDRTIFSVIKPSYCFMIDEDLHRFTQIWEQNWFCYCFWTILQAVHLKLFRSNNKNNFTLKWWLKYRNNRSVSWRLSCNCLMKKKSQFFLKFTSSASFISSSIAFKCSVATFRPSLRDFPVSLTEKNMGPSSASQ